MNPALIVIDMQNDFVRQSSSVSVKNCDSIIPSLKQLLEFFRSKGYPVIHVIREYRLDGSDIEKFRLNYFSKNPYAVPGTDGAKIIDELFPVENEIVLIKNRFSAFHCTELDLILRRKNISQLVISGIQYPNCLRASIFDAISLDYDVTVVYECAAAASKEIESANILDLQNVGTKFLSLQDFISENK